MIGVGVDLVDLDRFAGVLERRSSFVTRVYTARERAYCDGARASREAGGAVRRPLRREGGRDEGPGSRTRRRSASTTSRSSASESGDPTIALRGKAAAIAAERGAAVWHLSLSHSDAVAIAVVAAE